MKLYSNSLYKGQASHYIFAESAEEALKYELELVELKDIDGIYEVELKPGLLGRIDWTEPSEPFKSVLVLNPKESGVDGTDRSNRSDGDESLDHH